MKITVKVPATTANMGPGFDIFGLALPFYNEIIIEETVVPNSGIELKVYDEDGKENISIENDKENIIIKAIDFLYNFIGQDLDSIKITIKTGIPIARGLGSSASLIVGGLIAANKLLGEPADMVALMAIASEIEGHPDNITPAFIGGFTIASQEDDGHVVYEKIEWNPDWKLILCIPDYELQTGISRSVLPKELDYKSAIFNAKRCAMFIRALNTKNSELMKLALQDKLHEPYRMKLIPGLKEIKEKLKDEEKVLGCVISGAGPTVLIITDGNICDKVKDIVSEVWNGMNINANIFQTNVEEQGAYIVEE